MDRQGNVYVVDAGREDVQKLSPAGVVLARWGGAGSQPGYFDAPSGIAVDAGGSVYVADAGNGRIQEFTSSGRLLRLWVSSTPPDRFPTRWFTIVPTLALRIAVSPAGRVYAFEPCLGCVRTLRLREYRRDGRFVSERSIGLRGSQDPLPYAPLGLAVAAGGMLYLAFEAIGPANKGGAPEYFFLQKRSSQGRVLAQWGGLDEKAHDPAPARGFGLAVDKRGNLLVTDSADHQVIQRSPRGKVVARFGAGGCGPGLFDKPAALAVDVHGSIYVADRGNGTVQELSPSGRPIAFWGVCQGGLGGAA